MRSVGIVVTSVFLFLLVMSRATQALEITTAALPSGMEMVSYSATLEAANGEDFTWLVIPQVSVWGNNDDGQATLPEGLSHVIAVAGGEGHSLALKADGTVVAWGHNGYGQATVPEGLSGVIAIAGGGAHSLALKADGTVVAWGQNGDGQATVPEGLSGVIAIAGGGGHSLALKADGTVVAWGYNYSGQATVPTGLSDVIAIAGGGDHSLALKADGAVVVWGADYSGQMTVPTGLSGVIAIAGGYCHSLALKADGTVVVWGNQATVPAGLSGVVSIAGGGYHSLATITQLPEGLSLSAEGTLSGTPVLAGTYPLTFVVRDSANDTVAKELELLIEPNPNTQPVIDSSIPAQGEVSMDENSSLTFSVTAHDPQGAPLSYAWSWNGQPVGDGSDNYTHFAPWGAVGLHQLRCYVSDDLWTNVHAAWQANVEDIPLEITTAAIPSGMELTLYSATLEAINGAEPAWSVAPQVAAWGDHYDGQTTVPNGLINVIAIAGGYYHSLALKADGKVVAWGGDGYGQATVPADLSDVIAIAGGVGHNLALKSDGTVVGWGVSGQATVPAGLSGVIAIAAGGWHSLAIRIDGTVVAWGENSDGQSTVPSGLSGVILVAGGLYHSLALKADGTVVAWGGDGYGQATVPEGLSGVIAIAAGLYHSLALKADGTVVGWGYDWHGQATAPAGLNGVIAIAGGYCHSLALKADGTVVGWGAGGQAAVPAGLSGVIAIAAGDGHSLALRPINTQLPEGLSLSAGGMISGIPTLAATCMVTFVVQDNAGSAARELEIVIEPNPNTRPVIDSTVPAQGSVSMDENSSLTFSVTAHDPQGAPLSYAWSWDGQPVGDGSGSYTHSAPWESVGRHELRCYVSDDLWSNRVYAAWQVNVEDIPLEITTAALPSGMELMPYSATLEANNGEELSWLVMPQVAAWGTEYSGQATVPEGLRDVIAIAGGDVHSLALKANNTVVAWGANWYGQTTVPPDLTDVIAIAGGGEHSLALKADGTVVAWGQNGYGQKTVPAGLNGVIAIAGGGGHSLALKADGTVVGWGADWDGQATVPEGLSGVIAIAGGGAHSLALKADGTVVAWGQHDYGQTTVPTGLSDVIAIAGGYYHSLALKADGTVVGWGVDWEGQATVPAGVSGVIAIAGGWGHSLALRPINTQLPEGLSLSAEGMISGIPTLAATCMVTFVVRDNVGSAARELEVVIEPNPNTRPVIDSTVPAQGSVSMGEATSRVFSVTAHDPEGQSLTYAWTWGGSPVGGNSSTYTHNTDWGDAGSYELRCHVSDDLWNNIVYARWGVTVLDDNDGDGMLNAVERDIGRDPNNPEDGGAPSTLAGTIRGAGVEIEGAYLELRGSSGRVYQRAITDSAGNYHLDSVLPGKYFVKAGAERFADQWYNERDHYDAANRFDVPAETSVESLDFNLFPGQSPALVRVTSSPSDALVYVDYQPTGLVTPAVVAVGEAASHSIAALHTITVKKTGHPWPAPQTVTAVEAETMDVHFDLDAESPGSLTVRSTPLGATVYVDYADEPVGLSPVVVANLLPGSHTILLKRDGYLRPAPVLAAVESDSFVIVDVPLQTVASGSNLTVLVASEPAGATVYVDYLPTTNVTDVVVDWLDAASHTGNGWRSASHTIMLRKEGYLHSAPRTVDFSDEEQSVHIPLLRTGGSLFGGIAAEATQGTSPLRTTLRASVGGTNTVDLYFWWDLDGDGVWDAEGAGLDTVTNVFDRCGLYSISVTVSNAAGEVFTITEPDYIKIGPTTAYVALSGTHTFPYTDWTTAATNIEAAVQAGVDGTLVLVAEGTYVIAKQITIHNGIEIRSTEGAERTIIDGNRATRCFYVDSPDAVVDGFTITRGSVSEWPGGAGVCMMNGGVLQNCRVVDNRATSDNNMALFGGGVLCERGLVRDCVIENNAIMGWGGGVCCDDGGMVEDCEIRGNSNLHPDYGSGGGVYCYPGGVVERCTIQDNLAVRGGGGARSWDGRIENCVINDNVAGWGGGVLLAGSGTVSRCVIESNIATNGANGGDGGGVYFDYGGLMDGCVVSSNSATRGGGVMCGGMGATIQNTLIIHNAALQDGGGVALAENAVLANCTVSENTADQRGGGISSGEGAEVRNTILYLNTAPDGPNYFNAGTGGTFLFCCATPVPTGSGNLGFAPGFVNAAGGDYRLGESSPCLNAGTNAEWMADAFDLAGNTRVINAVVDIGAYESSHPASAGSRILRHTPAGNASPPISAMRFEFSYAMNPTTFNPADDIVSFTGPGGSIAVTGATWVSESTLEIRFAEQSQSGVYELIMAPSIADVAGREVDQNVNGIAAEPLDDRYAALFSIPSFWISGHSPSGDQVNPVSSVIVHFNKAVQHASFATNDVRVVGPSGPIPLMEAPTRINPTEYRIVFPTQEVPGDYHVSVGPNIASEDGAPLDQDGDGVTGELSGDVYDAGFSIIDVTGPKVLNHSPTRSGGAVSHLDLRFNEPLRVASFALSDVSIVGPNGFGVPIAAVTNLTSASFRVSFPAQTREGAYRVAVGPSIADAAGNLMDQDGDGRNGEAFDDRYRSEFVVDGSGPWVVGTSVGGTTQHVAVGAIEIAFNEPMAVATVTTNAIIIVSPCGTNSALSVSNLTGQTFLIGIPPCASNGVFTVHVAPLPTDVVGNQMDQDRDGIGGEPLDDRYSFDFIQQLPDLATISVTAPEECEGGTDVEVGWAVANRGLGVAAGGWRDGVYLSEDRVWNAGDTRLGDLAFPDIVESGASYERIMSVNMPMLEGVRRWLIVVADSSNDLAEAETALPPNNVAVSAVPIWFVSRPHPDLQVPSVIGPDKLHPGERARISWTVRNMGSRATSGMWLDRVYLSTTTNLNVTTAIRLQPDVRNPEPLAPGESYTRTLDFDIPAGLQGGPYFVIVLTDAQNQVNEFGGEGSNARSSSSSVEAVTPPPGFFTVESIEVPQSVAPGSDITFSWTVKNTGGATITATYAGYWDDGAALSRDAVYDANEDLWLGGHLMHRSVPLRPGESYTVRLPSYKPSIRIPNWAPGTYYLILIPDTHFFARTLGQELLKNYGVVPITIADASPAQKCDLTPTNLVVSTTGTAGQAVSVSWSVKNMGPGATWGDSWTDCIVLSTNLVWDAGDILLGERLRSGALAAGASYDVETASFTLPGDLQGDFHVLLKTDSGEVVYESDETNNVFMRAEPIQIESYDVDLTVASAGTTNQAVAGEPIAVQWVVANIGPDATTGTGWSDSLYLSASNTLDASTAHRLGVFARADNLPAGSSYTNDVTVMLPARIEGAYHLFVVCDSANQIFERTAENNNEYRIAPPITIAHLAPDLAVMHAVAPTNAIAGQSMAVNWWVTNAGTATARAPWNDAFYLSSNDTFEAASDLRLLTVTRTNDLQEQAGYALSETPLLVQIPDRVEGRFYLFVVADDADVVHEKGSELNNVFMLPDMLVVTDLAPDIRVQSATALTNGAAGELVRIEWSTINQGAEAVTNRWKDAVYLSANTSFSPADDSLFGHFEHAAPLEAGQTSSPPSQSTWMRLPDRIEGDYYVFVVADYENTVYEKDGEDSNVCFIPTPIRISHQPADLQVGHVDAPLEAMAGSVIPVTWSVVNRGGRPTAETFWQDGIYLSRDQVFEPASDIELGVVPRSGDLPVDGVYTQTHSFALRQDLEGDYYVYAVADVRRQVYEHNREENNSGAAPSTLAVVGLRTDLRVTHLTAPDAATVGSAVRVEWAVRNDGMDDTAVSAWSDAVYLSADAVLGVGDISLITNRHSGVLKVGATYASVATVSIPGNVAGSYHLIVKTDANPFNDVFEYEAEDNNTAAAAIQIALAPPPDLQVASVSVPASVWSGQSLPVSWTVSNEGDADAVPNQGRWFDNVYLSRDPYLDIGQDISLGNMEHVGPLASQASYSREISARIPYSLSGPYYVLVFADSSDRVAERGLEHNNVGVAPATVQIALTPPADLAVTDLAWPTNAVICGELTNFAFEVSNIGSQPAVGTWNDTLYLSADDRWDIDDPRIGRVRHEGDLATGQSYTSDVFTNTPAVIPGNYYVIARADIFGDVRETSTTNNMLVSTGLVTVIGRELVLAESQSNLLSRSQSLYYQVATASGDDLVVSLRGAATAGAELYLAFGRIPTRSDYDVRGVPGGSDSLLVRIPGAYEGTYYILIYGTQTCPEPSAGFEILATLADFAITDLSISEAGNAGSATVTINGYQFTPGMTVRLEDASQQVMAVGTVHFNSSGSLAATFDLTGVAPGDYTIVLEQPGGALTTKDFTVTAGTGGKFFARLQMPSFVRVGRTYAMTLEYGNEGDADIPSPLVKVTPGAGAEIRLFPKDLFDIAGVQVLAIADGNPAGILPPGTLCRIEMEYRLNTSDYVPFFLKIVEAGDQTPVDWDALEAELRPDETDAQVWQAAWSNLQTRLGRTWGTYASALGKDATRLARRGRTTRLVNELLNYEWQICYGGGASAVGGNVFLRDVGVPATGVVVSAVDPATSLGGRATVAADGSFLIEGLHPGSYVVSAEGPDSSTNLVTLATPQEDVLDLSLDVLPACAVAGFVLTNNMPAGGAEVSLWCENRDSVVFAEADTTGFYRFDALAAGRYNLRAAARGYAPATRIGVELAATGDRVQVDFDLVEGGAVEGVVRDPLNGGGVPAAHVNALGPDGELRDAAADADGRFTLNALSPGEWSLRATGAGFVPSAAQTVAVSTGRKVQVTFDLIGGASVAGTVHDAAGTPVSGAMVTIYSETSDDGSAAFTGVSGGFMLDGLPGGDYLIRAGAEGYGSVEISVNQLLEGERRSGLHVVLELPIPGAASVVQRHEITLEQKELTLEQKEWRLLYVVAIGLAAVEPAGSHLWHYLLPDGPNPSPWTSPIIYGTDSRVSGLAKYIAACDMPFFEVREIVESMLWSQIRRGLSCESKSAVSRLEGSCPALNFHGSPYEAINPLFYAFGGMQTGHYTFVPSGVTEGRSGNTVTVQVRGKVYYRFTDLYDFHLPEFWADRWAEELYDAGYASEFRTAILIEDDYEEFFTLTCGLPDPGDGEEGGGTSGGGSKDPNDKLVDVGVGESRFIAPDQVLGYTIRFENMSNATASAQLITVTDPLDANLDWSTFEFGDMLLSSNAVAVPPGLQYYHTRVDLRPYGNDLLVDIEAKLDRATGVATWVFSAIDPATGEFTEDFWDGFLPPNDDTHIGEGFVKFRIKPKPGLPNGTVIPNVAEIVFDWNEPIDTPPIAVTIDSLAPSSRVNALPQESTASFVVSWTGSDGTNGSGIASYDVYVSRDDGPFTAWLERTAALSARFNGETNTLYAFYTIARDQVGHVEAAPSVPDTATRTTRPSTPEDADGDGMPDDWERERFGSALRANALTDTDRDGMPDNQEYPAGTDPNNPNSLLAVESLSTDSIGTNAWFDIVWGSVSNRYYMVTRSTNLLSGRFQGIARQVRATSPRNTYRDSRVGAFTSTAFYRVGLEVAEPTVYGDVNGDDLIDLADAEMTTQAAADLITLTPQQAQAADVDGDGDVTDDDAALIVQYVHNAINIFPVEE